MTHAAFHRHDTTAQDVLQNEWTLHPSEERNAKGQFVRSATFVPDRAQLNRTPEEQAEWLEKRRAQKRASASRCSARKREIRQEADRAEPRTTAAPVLNTVHQEREEPAAPATVPAPRHEQPPLAARCTDLSTNPLRLSAIAMQQVAQNSTQNTEMNAQQLEQRGMQKAELLGLVRQAVAALGSGSCTEIAKHITDTHRNVRRADVYEACDTMLKQEELVIWGRRKPMLVIRGDESEAAAWAALEERVLAIIETGVRNPLQIYKHISVCPSLLPTLLASMLERGLLRLISGSTTSTRKMRVYESTRPKPVASIDAQVHQKVLEYVRYTASRGGSMTLSKLREKFGEVGEASVRGMIATGVLYVSNMIGNLSFYRFNPEKLHHAPALTPNQTLRNRPSTRVQPKRSGTLRREPLAQDQTVAVTAEQHGAAQPAVEQARTERPAAVSTPICRTSTSETALHGQDIGTRIAALSAQLRLSRRNRPEQLSPGSQAAVVQTRPRHAAATVSEPSVRTQRASPCSADADQHRHIRQGLPHRTAVLPGNKRRARQPVRQDPPTTSHLIRPRPSSQQPCPAIPRAQNTERHGHPQHRTGQPDRRSRPGMTGRQDRTERIHIWQAALG